ncbi:MAG TPA: choice-of-anchor D domain-containing protein [Rugosimonospora sp.]|nr:choice-of-anchor D domain-containing protein [Rugosimonospora sp.]
MAATVLLLTAAITVHATRHGPALAPSTTETTLVASAPTGSDVPGGAGDDRPAVSADGRFVAFSSDTTFAPLPAESDTGPQHSIYVRDTASRTTTYLSRGGTDDTQPTMSADGRYVAFASAAGSDSGSTSTIVVCDRGAPDPVSGEFRAGCAYTGLGGDTGAYQTQPSLSADGTRIAFLSGAHLAYADLTLARPGGAITGWTAHAVQVPCVHTFPCDYEVDSAAVLAAGGRYVATVSQDASSSGDSDHILWVMDLAGGPAQRLDLDGHGGTVGSASVRLDPNITLSGDGRLVAFTPATASVTDPPVYLVDRDPNGDGAFGEQPAVRIVSQDVEGVTVAGYMPALSTDGRFLAYATDALDVHNGVDDGVSNLDTCIHFNAGIDSRRAQPRTRSRPRVAATGTAVYSHCDVVVRDLTLDANRPPDGPPPQPAKLASPSIRTVCKAYVPGAVCEGDSDSFAPALDADGSAVAYASWADDLVPGDQDGTVDAFLHRFATVPQAPGFAATPYPLAFGPQALSVAGMPATVTVSNPGTAPLLVIGVQFAPATAGTFPGDYRVTQTTCLAAPVPAGGSCTVTLAFTPHGTGDRPAVLVITDNTSSASHTVPLTGSGVSPVLRADPPLAPPGAVSQVSGTGFPPGQTVVLTLSNMAGQTSVTASATGTFTTPLVILPHTLPGQQQLTATVPAVPGPLTVGIPFLVAPGSLQPPDFVNRR